MLAGEMSSGKLTRFLTCQSNPGPPLRGSWLPAFSLQFVIRASLHFDLIKPIGMAPNKNQSSRMEQTRLCPEEERLTGLILYSRNSLSHLAFFPASLFLLSHTIMQVHIGHKRHSFHLTNKGYVCLHDF